MAVRARTVGARAAGTMRPTREARAAPIIA